MKAYELISNESKWTQEAFARDCNGNSVSASAPGAISWCAIGAIKKAYPAMGLDGALNRLQAAIADRPVADWNDASDYETVVSLLRELDI